MRFILGVLLGYYMRGKKALADNYAYGPEREEMQIMLARRFPEETECHA